MSLFAVFALLAAGVILYLTREAVVSTEAHDVATSWLSSNPVVLDKLGDDIRFGFMPMGEVDDNTATLTYSLTGDKATGRAMLKMEVQDEEWVVTKATLESPEGRLVIAEQRPEDRGPDPESQHHVTRGAQLLNAGRTSEALKELEQAVIVDAYNPEAYVWRGRILLEMEQFDRAQQDFDRARELDADRPGVYQGLALIHSLQEDYEGALPFLDRWIELSPDDGEAWQERGYAAFKLGDEKTALADAEKACTLGFQPGCVAQEKLGGGPAPAPAEEASP